MNSCVSMLHHFHPAIGQFSPVQHGSIATGPLADKFRFDGGRNRARRVSRQTGRRRIPATAPHRCPERCLLSRLDQQATALTWRSIMT